VRGMNFQENPSNGSRDTSQKAQCFSSKVPLNTDRSKPLLSFVRHEYSVSGINFQKIPPT